MSSRMSRRLVRILSVLAVMSSLGIWASAQRNSDPNYDSPSPILLTDSYSTRALAQPAERSTERSGKVSRSRPADPAFQPNTKIVLYVSDLQLMKDEGANAFRIYAEDGRGHSYRFPVLDIQEDASSKNVWDVTVLLTDDVGYFEPLAADGDVLIYLTWRGMASNKVRLGIGKTGGDLKENADTRPTPIGTTALSNSTKAAIVNATQRANDHARFLEQATFGPIRNFDDQFAGVKLSRWMSNQFSLPYPSAANPYPNQDLKNGTSPADCDGKDSTPGNPPDVPATCYRDTYTMYPIQTWNSKESLYGDSQLHHKVSWALSQIWVTSGVDIQQSRQMVEWHKILSNNAFGNYRTLMGQMTLDPTMGEYLSMRQSTKSNPNENYAREVMQLFTVGLFMLNQDGTIMCVEHNPCQPGDTKVPTYDQTGVNNLTKVLTGWQFCQSGTPGVCPNVQSGVTNFIDPLLLSTSQHDVTAKTLLDYPGANPADRDIAACTGCNNAAITTYANSSMNHALDNLFNHPNVGPFVSKILIQQMVTSDPTPAYVGRVAAVFNNNGVGVRGDMKAVISAILLDPEARGNVKTDPNYGKLREPFQFATNILRSFNVRDIATTGQSDGVLTGSGSYNGMGQSPFRSPTVFNYYQFDFVIPGTALVGPEFALMTTGTAIQRANFVNQMVFADKPVDVSPNTNNGGAPSGTTLDFTDLQTMMTADITGNTVLTELDRRMLHGTMSTSMRNTVLTAIAGAPVSGTPTAAQILTRVRQAVYLVATSSQYQVQR